MGEISSHLRGVFRISAGFVRLFISRIWLKNFNVWLRLSRFLGEWFSQPNMTPYEHAQLGRILATILKVIFLAGVALFLVNIYIHAWNIAVAVLMVPSFCIPAFWLNSTGRHLLSASLTMTVLLCVADYNLYADVPVFQSLGQTFKSQMICPEQLLFRLPDMRNISLCVMQDYPNQSA